MKLLDSIAGKLGYVKAAPPSPPFLRDIAGLGASRSIDYAQLENQLRAYGSVSWVYFAVSRIAEAAAQVPFHVMRRSGEELEQIYDHEFERLMQLPNPKLTRFSLLEATFIALELTGNAYWWLNVAGGRIAEIWPLRADRVRPVPDPQKLVKGYLYSIMGHETTLEPEEVIHFKRWNPLNDFLGLSTISAAALAMETDREASRWNARHFSQDNAVPATAVLLPPIDDGTYERVKKEWRDTYGSAANAHKTAFLRTGDAGGVKIERLSVSQKDMEFIEGRRWNREELLMLFGIPLGKWSENATEANAKVAEATFLADTLWPKLVRVSEQVTTDILVPYYSPELVGAFSDVRLKNRDLELREMEAAGRLGVLSTDELRQRYFALGPMEPDAVRPSQPSSQPLEGDHEEVVQELLGLRREVRKTLEDIGAKSGANGRTSAA